MQHAMQLVITIFPFTFALALLLPSPGIEALNLNMGKFDTVHHMMAAVASTPFSWQQCSLSNFPLLIFFACITIRIVESWYSQNMERVQERFKIHSTSGSTTIHLDV